MKEYNTVTQEYLLNKIIKWENRFDNGGWLWFSKEKCREKCLYYRRLLNQFK